MNDRDFFSLPVAAPEEERGWAKQQKDRRSRSEAIRRLIEIALASKSKRQSTRDK
jgi:hypothetical protein